MVAPKLEVLHPMLSILANGTLIADPVERRSVNDKPHATCTMRVPCEDGEPMLVSVISFDADAMAALLALRRGDACAAGAFSPEWERAAKRGKGGEVGPWSSSLWVRLMDYSPGQDVSDCTQSQR